MAINSLSNPLCDEPLNCMIPVYCYVENKFYFVLFVSEAIGMDQELYAKSCVSADSRPNSNMDSVHWIFVMFMLKPCRLVMRLLLIPYPRARIQIKS